ncbi:MAG: glycosyltransferase [Phycisphaerales bacterium]|nr:glycosyltransferase [Phycisphaerales bacterium]
MPDSAVIPDAPPAALTPWASTTGSVAVADGAARFLSRARPATQAEPVVSVVLPVYNETRIIERTFTEVAAFARAHPFFRFLFVDDGSKDDTAAQLRRLMKSAPDNVAFHACPVNGGKGAAIRAGFARCDGDFILFTDGDLAYSLDHLPRLAEALRAADVAIGSRSLIPHEDRNVRLPRKVLGWGFNRLARAIIGLPHKDTQAGLKGFRRDAARRIFERQRLADFSFDVELLFLAHRFGYRVAEIPAHVCEGHASLGSNVRLLRDPLRMFANLLRIRWAAARGVYG